jgi:hypothetical protein
VSHREPEELIFSESTLPDPQWANSSGNSVGVTTKAGPGMAFNRAVYPADRFPRSAGACSRETRDGEARVDTETAIQAKRVRDRVNRYGPIAPAHRQFGIWPPQHA